MEEVHNSSPVENFDPQTSPAKEAYALLGANTPLELSNLYSVEDQKQMHSQTWDYMDEKSVVNKVKEIIESLNRETLTEDERAWTQEILWFWYHHAISCAVWRYKDRDAAKKYAAKALSIQPADHPNQITRLLGLLVNDDVLEAEKWANKIMEEPEKSTAADLVQWYKDGDFF